MKKTIVGFIIQAAYIMLVPLNLCATNSSNRVSVPISVDGLPILEYMCSCPLNRGAGYLIQSTGPKWYLPSANPVRTNPWTVRQTPESRRLRLPRQNFDFIMRIKPSNNINVPPYLGLQISVDRFDITNVEVIWNEHLVHNFPESGPKLILAELGIAGLCAKFCMFVDQLDYNRTLLGRGMGERAQNRIRQILLPLAQASDRYIERSADTEYMQPGAVAFQKIAKQYTEHYVHQYSLNQRGTLLADYVKQTFDLDGIKLNIRNCMENGGTCLGIVGLGAGHATGSIVLGCLLTPYLGTVGLLPALLGGACVGFVTSSLGYAGGIATGAMVGLLTGPATNFVFAQGKIDETAIIELFNNRPSIGPFLLRGIDGREFIVGPYTTLENKEGNLLPLFVAMNTNEIYKVTTTIPNLDIPDGYAAYIKSNPSQSYFSILINKTRPVLYSNNRNNVNLLIRQIDHLTNDIRTYIAQHSPEFSEILTAQIHALVPVFCLFGDLDNEEDDVTASLYNGIDELLSDLLDGDRSIDKSITDCTQIWGSFRFLDSQFIRVTDRLITDKLLEIFWYIYDILEQPLMLQHFIWNTKLPDDLRSITLPETFLGPGVNTNLQVHIDSAIRALRRLKAESPRIGKSLRFALCGRDMPEA